MNISLAQLEQTFGPPEHISWDEEPEYFQVYGDNGTICITDDRTAELIADTLRSVPALIQAAELLATTEDIHFRPEVRQALDELGIEHKGHAA